MELWIRNQDKENIIKVDALEISEEECDEEIIYEVVTFYLDKIIVLGYYKTKERALEVLDEIQNIIIGKYMTNLSFEASFSKFDDEEEARKTLIAMAVYEMPEE